MDVAILLNSLALKSTKTAFFQFPFDYTKLAFHYDTVSNIAEDKQNRLTAT
jgi:hypothetical protein